MYTYRKRSPLSKDTLFLSIVSFGNRQLPIFPFKFPMFFVFVSHWLMPLADMWYIVADNILYSVIDGLEKGIFFINGMLFCTVIKFKCIANIYISLKYIPLT